MAQPIKKFIIKIFSNKYNKIHTLNLHEISTILINPIGDAIGDSIIHTAHFRQLKSFNPNLRIAVFASNRNRDILLKSGLVDVVLEKNLITAYKERGKWELLLDFCPTFTSKFILIEKLIKPKFTLIFYRKWKKHYNISSVQNYHYHCISDDTHASEYLNHPLFSDYLNPENAKYTLNISHNKKISFPLKVVLAPQGTTRFIPVEEVITLLNHIDSNLTDKIQIILSMQTNQQEYFNSIQKNNTHKISISQFKSSTIEEYIQLIADADIVISVDSGSVHLACALEKPLLAFYANNKFNISKWKPKMPKHIPCRMITNQLETDSNNTKGFPMDIAAEWLNQELNTLLSNTNQ